jgi:hypothetical protein
MNKNRSKDHAFCCFRNLLVNKDKASTCHTEKERPKEREASTFGRTITHGNICLGVHCILTETFSYENLSWNFVKYKNFLHWDTVVRDGKEGKNRRQDNKRVEQQIFTKKIV